MGVVVVQLAVVEEAVHGFEELRNLKRLIPIRLKRRPRLAPVHRLRAPPQLFTISVLYQKCLLAGGVLIGRESCISRKAVFRRCIARLRFGVIRRTELIIFHLHFLC